MGLLDDAIKEHLELKRRRGADPNEVERLEREALGPVRRGTQASDEAVLDEDAVLDETTIEHPDRESVLYDDLADEASEPPELADEPAFAREPEHEPFPEDESEQGWSHEPAEAWDTEEPLAAEEPHALAAEPGPSGTPAEQPPPAPAEPRSDHP